jgi:hypothetical protein
MRTISLTWAAKHLFQSPHIGKGICICRNNHLFLRNCEIFLNMFTIDYSVKMHSDLD